MNGLERLPWAFLSSWAIVLGIVTGIAWWEASGSMEIGIGATGAFLAFVGGDALMLIMLPRLGYSFGPPKPPFVAFTFFRLFLSLGLLPLQPLSYAIGLALIGQLAFTGNLLNALYREPFRLTLTELVIRSPKLRGMPPLRILHLTDLHLERLTRREQQVLRWVEELDPDLIVFTGDLLNLSYVRDPQAQAQCSHFLEALRAPLGIYLVTGTPLVDPPDVVRRILFGFTHITWLDNQVARFGQLGHRGPSIYLLGLTCTHDPDRDGERLRELMRQVPPQALTILLYHSPDLFPEASALGIDLYLCGHTHGGQIRLPLIGALITASIYGKRYEMGLYQRGSTTMYVSRGLGMEGLGMPRIRLMCPPEIVLIHLQGNEEEA
ncbi:MAG: metallophosphoesterase [Anaerolineae bacterium]|nr:metallophosphoesterase [Anaerolineae bacterium]